MMVRLTLVDLFIKKMNGKVFLNVLILYISDTNLARRTIP